MNEKSAKENVLNLPLYAHVIAGWPLLLIFIGGVIGGLCGGGAYGASVALLKKKGVTAVTCLLSFLIGIAGVALYFVVAVALVIAFPDMFSAEQ